MKELHLVFAGEDGKKWTLKPKAYSEDLTPTMIEDCMNQIIALNLFADQGYQLATKVVSAHYREVNETSIFTKK